MAYDPIHALHWREQNKEKVAESNRKYYYANKEELNRKKREYNRLKKLENPDYYKEEYRKTAIRRSSDKSSFVKNKYTSQMYSAKVRNIEWSLDKESTLSKIMNSTHCAISGVKLVFKIGHKHAPSIDRKNSSRGYAPGNIQIVSTIVNKMKQDLSQKEFKLLCKKISGVA